jgi:hypothetical protein
VNALATEVIDERLDEIERMAAVDLVMKLRSVEVLNRTATNGERRLYSKVFERIGNQFLQASTTLKRERPEIDIPEFLRPDSTVSLTERLK